MDPFVRAALVGVEKDAPPPATGTAVDALFADDADFLRRAGARHLYVRAGLVASHMPDPPEAAPPETLVTPSPRLDALVTEIVEEGERDLLRMVVEELAGARRHIPHHLLPEILGMREKVMLPVVGERGRWLARKNPEWSWAAGGTTAIDLGARWDEGSTAQRLEAFREMRAADPAMARAKLLEVWPKEKAEQRLAFIQTLDAGLSPGDEEFLEQVLGSDRSMNVKGVAADLLARLPQSQYVARMTKRAEAAVTLLDPPATFLSKLMARSAAKLVVELPPEPFDAATARDVIPARAPQSSGVRAWALSQIIGAVPPTVWTSRFNVTPQQLIAMASESLFPAPLIEGWVLATVRHPDTEWARAIVAALPKAGPRATNEQRAELLRALPPGELIELAKGRADYWSLDLLVALLPRPWAVEFARMVMRRMRDAAAQGAAYAAWYDLCAIVPQVARAIPQSLFAEALAAWDITTDAWQSSEWTRQLRRFHQIIAIRKLIAEENRS